MPDDGPSQESSNGAAAIQDAPVYYGRGGKYTAKPRVVVLGSGWAAMSFIKSLSKRER
jgi:hypothetical protein